MTTAITGAVLVATIVSLTIFFFPALRSALLGGSGQPPAALILNGQVVPGGLVSIHGSNFSSGGTINITVDGHAATIASEPAGNQAASDTQGLTTFALGASQSLTGPSGGSTILVKSDGSFDVAIRVDANWPAGSIHVIVATEQSSGKSARLTITVPQKTALASCSRSTNTTNITLGPVTVGQSQPVAAPFTLCTTGSGTVNWAANWNQQQATWLHLASSGKIQAPLTQQLLVSASSSGLKAGFYQATVTFSSQGSSLKMVLNVTFIVRPPNVTTCINTSTQVLSFIETQGKGNPASQTVTISNCGDPNAWSASIHTDDGANWLGIGLNSGTLPGKGTQVVPARVTSTILTAGTYSGQITFKVGTSTATVNVILTVQPPVQNACVIANPNAIGFTAIQGQGNPGAQTVTIGNCGSSGVWSASSSTTDGANWLNINQAHGNLNANGTSDVAITVTSSGLHLGTYTGQVTFRMGSSTATVSVFFDIQQMQNNSCITSDTGTLVFTTIQGQGDPDPQGLTLFNCGTTGDWSARAVNDSSWLGVSPTHGHLQTGGSQDILVAVRTAHLDPGEYHDRLIFTLGSSFVEVNVTLVVQQPKDCIQASVLEFNFYATQGGDNPSPQIVTIANCGGSAGDWSAVTAHNSTWLGFHPTQGHLEVGASEDVKVGVSSVGLVQGDYHDQIAFTLGSSTVVVEVNLLVQQPPQVCIQANPALLVFTAIAGQHDPDPQTVTLTNCGSAADWSAASAHGSTWLSANKVNGHLGAQGTPGAAQDVQVVASIANLPQGTYHDQIIFRLGTSTAIVNIELDVSQQPRSCLQANTSSLTFMTTQGQGDPAPQTVTLTNCGSAGDWSAASSNNSPWLSAYAPNNHLEANATQDVTVEVSVGRLGPGQNIDTLVFKLGSATAMVKVTFDIIATDCIQAVNTGSLTFTATQGQADPAPQTVTFVNGCPAGDWSATVANKSLWTSLKPANGHLEANAMQDVSVAVSIGNLAPGEYRDQIILTLGSSTAKVDVVFTIAQGGGPTTCIKANTQALAFTATQGQGDPAPQTVTLTNCGPAGDWSAVYANNSNWIKANLVNGHLEAGATQDVSVSVSSSGLNPDTYHQVLIFSLGGAKVRVNVTFTLTAAAPPPPTQSLTLTVSPSPIDSSDTKTCTLNSDSSGWTCNVTVTEDASSSGSLNWMVGTDLAGVNFSPNNGTLTPGGSTQMGITIPATSCIHGTFNFTVQGGKTVVVPWRCTPVSVPPPPPPPSVCIKASTDALTFTTTQGQGDPAPQTVTLTNCGPAGDWSAVYANNSNWIKANLINGHLEAGATQDVSVSVSSSGLNPDTYHQVLIFSLGGAKVRVNVTFTLTAAAPPPPPPPSACINASTHLLSFSATQGQGNPAPQTVTLSNCGSAGDWSVVSANGSGWINVSPGNGHLEAGATQDVSVNVSTGNLNADSYRDVLFFSLGGAKVRVVVTFIIAAAAPPPPPPAMPCIQVNTGSLSFSATQGQGDPAPQSVTITNCGDPGKWYVSISTDDGAHWLFANTRAGALDGGASQDVAIGATNSLPPGTYTGHITFTITTNGGTKSVTVDVTYTVS